MATQPRCEDKDSFPVANHHRKGHVSIAMMSSCMDNRYDILHINIGCILDESCGKGLPSSLQTQHIQYMATHRA